MAALDFPTATAAGQTFEADTGVIYVYVGTPPNGFWSANAGVSGQAALDARYVQVAGDTMTGNLINNASIFVGTTSGNRKVVVQQANSTAYSSSDFDQDYHLLKLRNSTDSKSAGLQFSIGANGEAAITATEVSDGEADLCFATRGGGNRAERARIDSSGNVLIGTTNAVAFGSRRVLALTNGTTGGVLSLYNSTTATANTRISSNPTGSEINDIGIHAASTNGSIIAYTNNDTERLRITSDGKIGVGSSTINFPSGTGLQVYDSTTPRFKLANSTTGTGATDGSYLYVSGSDFIIENKESANMRFYTSATERLRITSDGKLGVGAATPASNLDFGLTSNNASIINLRRNVGGGTTSVVSLGVNAEYGARIAGPSDATAPVSFGTISTSDGTTFSEKVRITSDGKLGVGTISPSNFFEVVSSVTTKANFTHASSNKTSLYLESDDTSARVGSTYYGSGGSFKPLQLLTSGQARMTVATSGNLGIGTAAPYAILGGRSLGIANSGGHVELNFLGSTTSYQGIYFGKGTSGNDRLPGYIEYKHNDNFMRFSVNLAERMRIDNAGNVGINVTSPTSQSGKVLHIAGDSGGQARIHLTTSASGHTANDGAYLVAQGAESGSAAGTLAIMNLENSPITFHNNSTERMRLDANGNLGVGIVNPSDYHANAHRLVIDGGMTLANATMSSIFFADSYSGTGEYVGQLNYDHGSDRMEFIVNNGERMRIDSSGNVLIGTTTNGITAAGTVIRSTGETLMVRSSGPALLINRTSSDGGLIDFRQNNTSEGSISVSGSTVSLVGGHLTRWSQLPGNAIRVAIYRGTVLSNIDEMCEWGDEDNEQLNRMKISDVEGDRNVSGVFQGWDEDDEEYTDDFYCAMTGDFVIRIGKDITVERGDLLMSAGDGTAKPQEDDIIRSKTIAKVTSTHVSETYNDGSYCVPCVLMAC
tara:strand:+ start:675 stop:3485 length:2811 start_codon:yes stop_codon:yes gene_type:complete